jgi:ABC-type sulfate transport system permease component
MCCIVNTWGAVLPPEWREAEMVNLVTSAILLALLFGSTTAWAVVHVRGTPHEQPVEDMLNARLWAAAMSGVLIVVLILGSVMALFSPGETGLARLLAAMSSPAVGAALGACALVSLDPVYLCARIGMAESGQIAERLHLSLHVGLVYAVIVVLLDARSIAG